MGSLPAPIYNRYLRGMKHWFPIFFCLSSSFCPAFAQQPASTAPLQRDSSALREIVVLAPYRAGAETPVSFQNLNLVAIEQQNVGQEPAFLLARTPSMTVHSDAGSLAGYAYFRLRGIDQTRLNATLNGAPLNEPEDQGVYFNNFPDFLNSVQSLQIQRGVGTSTNGVASYAGSLNFESAALTQPARREVGVGYGSFGTYRLYGEYASGLRKQQGLYLRASALHSDGYKDRSGHDSQSAFYSYGFLGGKHLFKLTGFVGHQRNQQAWIGAPLDSLGRNPRYSGNSNERDEFVQSFTQGQHSVALGSRSTLSTGLYYNFLSGNYDFDLNNFLELPRTDELYNYALRSHFVGLFSTFSFDTEHLKLSAGVHGNLYQRRHVGSERLAGELYRNTGHKNEASAFGKISYTAGPVTLFGDVQGRYAEFRYKGRVALPLLTYKFLNPRAGITYQLATPLSAYYSVGRTGREPTRNDLFGGNDDLPADSLGQPTFNNLPAESVVDHELGLKWTFGCGHVFANGYYMNFRDEIVLSGKVGPTGLPLRANAARSYRSGLELDAQLDVAPGWRLTNNSSLSRNRIREGETSIEPVLTPTVVLNQEVARQWKRLWVAVSARYQNASFIDYGNQFVLPAFHTLGLAATYAVKNIELSVKANNLTNQRYYTYGQIAVSGKPHYFIQAPLNYFLAVKYRF